MYSVITQMWFFTIGVHFSNPLFIICHLRRIKSTTAIFLNQALFLADHTCCTSLSAQWEQNIFKMAKLTKVPRLINGRVPSKVDKHSACILLLLVLWLCLPIFHYVICIMLSLSLPTFRKILKSKNITFFYFECLM